MAGRIDDVVQHFPKGIGESSVSGFTELLQGRMAKEGEAVGKPAVLGDLC